MAAIDPGAAVAFGFFTATVGWAFTVNDEILVTDLGYFDLGQDGLVGSHDVGIWTSGGTLLASGTVTNADPLVGDFRYTDISDIILVPGNYVVGGLNNSADDYIAASSFTTPAEITFVQGRAVSGGALAFPTSVDNTGAASIFGGSFEFEAIPEPGTVALLGLALASFAASRRRKQ